MCKMKSLVYKHKQKVVKLYLPVFLVNYETLPYLQDLGKLVFGPVHEASATNKCEYVVK